jgi:hypothetical protein
MLLKNAPKPENAVVGAAAADHASVGHCVDRLADLRVAVIMDHSRRWVRQFRPPAASPYGTLQR